MGKKNSDSRGRHGSIAAEPSKADTRAPIQTKIIDDVFADAVEMIKPRFEVDYEAYLERLWNANPEIYTILKDSSDLEDARDMLYTYLERAEREIFKVDNDLHILEKATVRESIRVFKSIIGPVNEFRTGVSALDLLWKLSRSNSGELPDSVSPGFLMEFINLFRGVAGKSNIYFESREAKKGIPDFFQLEFADKECKDHLHDYQHEDYELSEKPGDDREKRQPGQHNSCCEPPIFAD